MNDETREQLSAYLDGALPEAARRDLEARLAASAELRGALEDLRAVSRAVKALPKEPLPPGFLARFQARRARGDAPRQDWVFLPPQARPVVAALSIGVVALALWDKISPPEPDLPHPPEAATVFKSADAPVAQLDLSRGANGTPGSGARLSDAKALEIAGAAQKPAPQGDQPAYLDGGGQDGERAKGSAAALRGASSGRAAGQPLAASAEPEPVDRTRLAMTEEERSARNEEMFGELEKQKQRMGIKKVIASGVEGAETGGVGFLAQREPPAAPVVRAAVPTLLNSAAPQGSAALAAAPAGPPGAAGGRLAPDAGLVFTDAGSLSSSWVLLGLPGDPPVVDFANGRLIMIKPSATKILSVTPGPDAVIVVYRSLLPDEASDPARDRVAPLPAAPKAVLIYDASPR